MIIVFDTSPLIFLSKLKMIENAFQMLRHYEILIPQNVVEEIMFKEDSVYQTINDLLEKYNIKIRKTYLTKLYTSINEKLGKGESEAIAISLELNADYVILDDYAARKEAEKLGLSIAGTLSIIKNMQEKKIITIENLEEFYKKLRFVL